MIGIPLAVLIVAGVPALATAPFCAAWGVWLSLVGFAANAWVLIRIPTWREKT